MLNDSAEGAAMISAPNADCMQGIECVREKERKSLQRFVIVFFVCNDVLNHTLTLQRITGKGVGMEGNCRMCLYCPI